MRAKAEEDKKKAEEEKSQRKKEQERLISDEKNIKSLQEKLIKETEQGKKNSTALISNKRVGVNFKNKKYVEIPIVSHESEKPSITFEEIGSGKIFASNYDNNNYSFLHNNFIKKKAASN